MVTFGLLLFLLLAPAADAPGAQTPPPPDLGQRVAALEAQNRAILQELRAIRAMLLDRGATAPRAAAPAQGVAGTGPEVDLMMSIAGRPVKGKPTAKLAIVEFTDFECPFCGRYARETYPQVVKELVDTGRAMYVFRHYPIPSLHPNATNAARASECAFAQGKFWEFHDRLFSNQQRLQPPQLTIYGQGLGMNDAQFAACVAGTAMDTKVAADRDAGARAGVTGTPGFFIGEVLPNGQVRLLRRFKGAVAIETFRAMAGAVEAVLAKR